ncbi:MULTISPECIES: trans-aconitate 2-methyltransferase [unclassified Micromonospora]|uniref:class I SAM-dependent methyltransferase n=1 Tax=unclassified Micromonospora TaxID=2617518 RepID=UPI0015921D9B|nr:class I SAM-dependent methyltransferase [Verrucosispora sp. NA02020]QKW14230.1 class I SAM-dependent methyltransferase [Verrucosispora sp. NA02020]
MAVPREQRTVFGEVADAYERSRADYPAALLDLITGYTTRTPAEVVEAGAGTGKGSALLRRLDVPLTCVEPDPAMAALLARRFTGDDLVSVVVGRFEDWRPPPGGVDLVASAQAWHWVDHTRRTDMAAEALAPGGVLAIFGHDYGFADVGLRTAMDAVYQRYAPEIADLPGRPVHTRHPGAFDPQELRTAPGFTDVTHERVVTVVPYDTARYLTLLSTFSPHRMLPEAQRTRLHGALADLVDTHGGVVAHELTTWLWLARRCGPAAADRS